ncbi:MULTISPECIES: hypothetical protein [Micromonospora]|uniref:hypothetical protein n=1 Tax=Micromonospora TaxID=1873 RepID=UPI0011B44562|nr:MULTISPECIES: hypothetical protein [unclassified Micromonospora]MBM0225456.1 hypothetical protein [Micromonospora sp. ATA51]
MPYLIGAGIIGYIAYVAALYLLVGTAAAAVGAVVLLGIALFYLAKTLVYVRERNWWGLACALGMPTLGALVFLAVRAEVLDIAPAMTRLFDMSLRNPVESSGWGLLAILVALAGLPFVVLVTAQLGDYRADPILRHSRRHRVRSIALTFTLGASWALTGAVFGWADWVPTQFDHVSVSISHSPRGSEEVRAVCHLAGQHGLVIYDPQGDEVTGLRQDYRTNHRATGWLAG